jgi:hypothetical protein
MRTAILKIVGFLGLIIFMDFAVGKAFEKFYFSTTACKNEKLIHSLMTSDEDVLFFGSSRAQHHYVPDVFKDSLQMSCFNNGLGGQNIYFHKAILESTLTRYTPKVILLDLFSIDFEKTDADHDKARLTVFLPFSHVNTAARNTVLMMGWQERIKLLSKSYPFNSTFYKALRNNYFPVKAEASGYIPIHKLWNRDIENENRTLASFDDAKVRSLISFIDLAKAKFCKVIIVISPSYSLLAAEDNYKRMAALIKDRTGTDVWDYRTDSDFLNHRELFADVLHLNETGARFFSGKIAHRIKVEVLSK